MGCSCSKPQPPAARSGSGAAASSSPLPNDIRSHYRIGSILGSGSFGQVRVCVRKNTDEVYAVKIMSKDPPKEKRGTKSVDFVLMFRNEVRILNSLNHPNVIKIYEHFEDKSFLYVVMDNCGGGELFSHIVKRRRFPETEAALLCKQMLDAIQYIHSVGVIHRDIKAENFLFKTARTSSPPELVLIDFGMSTKVLTPDHSLKQLCGSPHYVAPELIRRNYLFKVDMWALGVIVFLMLYGKYPFEGADQKSIVDAVLYSQPDYSRGNPPSDLAIEFMKALLEKDPTLRLSPYQAQNHEWILQRGRRYNPITYLSAPSSRCADNDGNNHVNEPGPSLIPSGAAPTPPTQHSRCSAGHTASPRTRPFLAGSCRFEDLDAPDGPDEVWRDTTTLTVAAPRGEDEAGSSPTLASPASLCADGTAGPPGVATAVTSLQALVHATAAPPRIAAPTADPTILLGRARCSKAVPPGASTTTRSCFTATTTASAASCMQAALPQRPVGPSLAVPTGPKLTPRPCGAAPPSPRAAPPTSAAVTTPPINA